MRYEGRIYEVPANRHLTFDELKERVLDTVKIHSVHGGDVAFDLVRTHMTHVHECRTAMLTYAFVLALVMFIG